MDWPSRRWPSAPGIDSRLARRYSDHQTTRPLTLDPIGNPRSGPTGHAGWPNRNPVIEGGAQPPSDVSGWHQETRAIGTHSGSEVRNPVEKTSH
jgi:hypothetical protein